MHSQIFTMSNASKCIANVQKCCVLIHWLTRCHKSRVKHARKSPPEAEKLFAVLFSIFVALFFLCCNVLCCVVFGAQK